MEEFMKGKTILGIKIADDKKAIKFICEDGEHVAKADGDCCSSSWIEGVETPALGLPATVINVEDLSLDGVDTEWGCIAYYGCKLTTDKGDMVIDYRNESNGYYGGDLVWPNDRYFYGGVYGQNISSENWVDLEDAQ